MLRDEALKRIQQGLESRRRGMGSDLTEKLGHWAERGDSADAAFSSGSDEIHSQVAQIEAGELALIDRALERIRKGTYGICEYCQKPIPTGRLNALPYSVLCIKCQQDTEDEGFSSQDQYSNWSRVNDGLKGYEDHSLVDIQRLALELR